MNRRQELALLHPLNAATDPIDRYRVQKRHPTGLLLVTILAVDR